MTATPTDLVTILNNLKKQLVVKEKSKELMKIHNQVTSLKIENKWVKLKYCSV